MATRMTPLMAVWFTLEGGDLAAVPELLIVIAVLGVMTLFPRIQARSNLAPVAVVIALITSLRPLVPVSLLKPAHITRACNKTWAVLVYLTARYDPFPDRIAADRVLITLLPLIALLFFGTDDGRRMHRIEI
ncbi:uncharacterized protein LOC62_02G003415 [Vanrija pseudolonga]|uniref:Transmembrane protein n=1 Tax=Vanrija pseudolonga TaxID=143232 RepID=A0AAF1BGK2_9TREE|nr:hypothetical protein LOC62_02G003415 [Vanrija pseudolonga]